MKRILFISMISLLFLCSACDGKGGNNNQNSASTIDENLKINIQGKIHDDEYAVNPIFNWQSSTTDSSYTVSLSKNGSVVNTKDTEETSYQFSKILDSDTEYEFKVEGKDSHHTNSIRFKTLSNYNNTISIISLYQPYQNGMVIQRDMDIQIPGVGPMSQNITLSIGNDKYTTISDEKGHFEFNIPGREGSFAPTELIISNGATVKKALTNVLFGDVYLFAGQSNMQWPTKDADFEVEDISDLIDSSVRFFAQDVVTSTNKRETVKNGRWFKPDSDNVSGFSAIATLSGAFLGRELKNDVPIGIVTAYQGNTNIADWMGPEYYTGQVSTKYLHYNAMIYPLRHTKLSGVVWYQGCNNSAAGNEYKDLLLKLFANYRDLFQVEDLPFYVIGLACYDGDSGNNYDFSYVRESQALACDADDNAYFISSCDDGDPTFIHPYKKRYICERVAKSISATKYGKDYYAEGPSYKSHTVDGNVVTISLNNAGGLRAEGEIINLLLAGDDGKYYTANASIDGETIKASSPMVDKPVYIKYGFGKSPFVNIFNKDNFSMVPFRTDKLNTNIDLFDYESTKNYYFHANGSNMNVSINNGNLAIVKEADGLTYGSVRLAKWGAIIYEPQGFRFTVKGTNSGASIAIRFIEGSYEVWGYKITDDFEGERTFEIPIGDITVLYNKQDNRFDTQKIEYIELMVETSGYASFELCEARFIEIERSAPLNFTISNVVENDDNVTIGISKSLFAEKYQLEIESDGKIIHKDESTGELFTVDKSLFEVNVPYYITVKASNELGENMASNSGYVFYLKDENKLIISNFDFANQASLDAYIESSMSVHAGLTCTLADEGIQITSAGQGWQQFIFKLNPGSADGMKNMEFKADFSDYKGEVVLQLADTSYTTYTYRLDLSSQKDGVFTINFNEFLSSGTPFTTQTLMWVMFNFNDNAGGTILFDDLSLNK